MKDKIKEAEERHERELKELAEKHKAEIEEIMRENGSGWYRSARGAEYTSVCASVFLAPNSADKNFGFGIRTTHVMSEETAKKYAERIELYLRMSKWADENNGEFESEYYWLYTEGGSVDIDFWRGYFRIEPMQIYFSSETIAEKAREKFGPDILRVWGK